MQSGAAYGRARSGFVSRRRCDTTSSIPSTDGGAAGLVPRCYYGRWHGTRGAYAGHNPIRSKGVQCPSLLYRVCPT